MYYRSNTSKPWKEFENLLTMESQRVPRSSKQTSVFANLCLVSLSKTKVDTLENLEKTLMKLQRRFDQTPLAFIDFFAKANLMTAF